MENIALKQQEKIFYNAMVKVNYASTLNIKDVCNYLNLTQEKIFNSDFYFIAFENASQKL
jgi:hypothetical protein